MDFLYSLLANLNYTAVFILMTVESTVIPFPSEVVVPPAAYRAADGSLNVVLVVLVATLGADVGAIINYAAGYFLGRPVIYRFADSKLGHACMIDRAKVEKAEAYFDKHGAVSTFVGRLIPAIRQLISIPAGISRMNVGQFALFTALGAGVWNAILAGLGYWLSTAVPPEMLFEKVEEYNRYLTWAGYGILLICILIILWNAFGKHRKK